MAITTKAGAIAGQQPMRYIAKQISSNMTTGRAFSLWGLTGSPGAGSYDTTLNGVTLSSTSAQVAGQIPFYDPPSGSPYLSRFQMRTTNAGLFLLCDRIWHNGGYTITSTSAQNSTTPTWPARDIAGSTDGDGVYLGLEISSATGSGTPTITISYTNQAGTSSRSATNISATTATSIASSFYQIGLQAGDTGVRAVASLTLSATWTSGTMNLVAYRVIAALDATAANIQASIDTITANNPILYNGSVPFIIYYPSGASAGVFAGQVGFTWG